MHTECFYIEIATDSFKSKLSLNMTSISSVAETVSQIVECFYRIVFVNGHRFIECALSIFVGAAGCKWFVLLDQMDQITE